MPCLDVLPDRQLLLILLVPLLSYWCSLGHVTRLQPVGQLSQKSLLLIQLIGTFPPSLLYIGKSLFNILPAYVKGIVSRDWGGL